jgi:hypothetical protein
VQGIRNQHWCNNWIYVPCLMPTLLPILIPSYESTVALPHICLGLFWLKLSFSRCDVSNVLVVYKMMPQHCFDIHSITESSYFSKVLGWIWLRLPATLGNQCSCPQCSLICIVLIVLAKKWRLPPQKN